MFFSNLQLSGCQDLVHMVQFVLAPIQAPTRQSMLSLIAAIWWPPLYLRSEQDYRGTLGRNSDLSRMTQLAEVAFTPYEGIPLCQAGCSALCKNDLIKFLQGLGGEELG